jgi:hypothetical protein
MNKLQKMYLIINIARVIKSKRISGRDMQHTCEDEKFSIY